MMASSERKSGSVATYSASFLKTEAYFLIDQAAAFFACFGEAKRITRTGTASFAVAGAWLAGIWRVVVLIFRFGKVWSDALA